jgi:hypothetical protein
MAKTKTMTWKKAYEEMRSIAGEAIALAWAYAGRESETLNTAHLNEQYEKLNDMIQENPPKE